MNLETVIYLVLLLSGTFFIYWSYKAKKLGWFRFIYIILLVQATRDLGLSPLYANLIVEDYYFDIFERVHGIDAYRSLSLIGLCYASLASGIWLIYRLVGKTFMKVIACPPPKSLYSKYIEKNDRKGYVIAAVMAAAGLWANIMVVAFLLSEFNILEIATTRAVFSAELNITDYRYAYLRMLSDLLLIGSLAMVYFSRGRGWRYVFAISITLLQIAFEVLYGGRMRMLQGLILLLIVSHLVKPIRLKRVVLYCVMAFLLMITIGNIRSDVTGAGNLIQYSLRSFSMQSYTRVDDTAFIMSLFPERIQYTGWLNFLGSTARVIPAVSVPGTNSLYGYLVDELYGGENPQMGIGGMNFSTAAEFYSWGGISPVIVFGIIYGCIYAYLLFWTMRYRHNPLVVLFALLLFIKSFLWGVSTRIPDTLGAVFTVFVSLSVIASLLFVNRDSVVLWVILFFDGLMFCALNISRDDGATIIPKVFILLTVPFLYYICIKIMRRTNVRYLHESADSVCRIDNGALVER